MSADPVEFLRARLDDTARLAQAYLDRREHESTDRETWAYKLLLAEVDAKRQSVDLHQADDDICRTWAWPCPMLRLLVVPYADHPDYQPEWRP